MKRIICTCLTTTPKGIQYHPTLKSVYERVGAEGSLTKTGFKCPKCDKFYNLDGEEA